jgi:hypothetical protein
MVFLCFASFGSDVHFAAVEFTERFAWMQSYEHWISGQRENMTCEESDII